MLKIPKLNSGKSQLAFTFLNVHCVFINIYQSVIVKLFDVTVIPIYLM